MSNERKLRLIQVAKEFKVGLNTITDFLQKKGIKTDGSPNTLVEPNVYAVLERSSAGAELPATRGTASGKGSPKSKLRSPSRRHKNSRAKRHRR